MPWNGSKGGVLALNVDNTLTLNANIDVSGKGFRGGTASTIYNASWTCSVIDYKTGINYDSSSQKGEGIPLISNTQYLGRGALGNGGGGGNAHNSGGGGGSNGCSGGVGGYQMTGCIAAPTTNISGGIGGNTLTYNAVLNKIFLGGGGGAGHANNLSHVDGGTGGGIIIINAATIVTNGKSILSKGNNAPVCNFASPTSSQNCGDGTGGGGGGGTIVLNSAISGTGTVTCTGGNGALVNYTPANDSEIFGPGGGGGGGVFCTNQSSVPPTLTVSLTPGVNGTVLPGSASNITRGAQAGTAGQTVTGWPQAFPVDTFKPNVINIAFSDSVISCYGRKFSSVTTTTGKGIASLTWYFGNSASVTGNNVSYTFTGYGSFSVKLVVADSNGCMDSLTQNLTIPYHHFAYAGKDTNTCLGIPLLLTASGGVSYQWSSAGILSSTNTDTTHVTPVTNPTPFYVSVTDINGCIDQDTVLVGISTAKFIKVTPRDTAICLGGTVHFQAQGALSYTWSPGNLLNDSLSPNPTVTNISGPLQIVVNGINESGCADRDTVKVSITHISFMQAAPADTTVCKGSKIQVNATGGTSYLWTPGELLNDSLIANPIATIHEQTQLVVTGKNAAGCTDSDTITVNIRPNPTISITTDGNNVSCDRKSVQLYATGALGYVWHPGIYCNDSLIPSPIVSPTKTTTFTVSGMDLYGCSDTSSYTVVSYYESSVFLPNAFTPDGDGNNDIIKPMIYCNFSFEEFRIFNRWGECVFYTKIAENGWNGDYKGMKADMGVYNYYIKGKTGNGDPVLMKGNITLLH